MKIFNDKGHIYLMNPTKLNIPNDIDWDFLKRFNICTHSSSFVEAAKKLGTSQASLLRQMDVLETELGKNLFERTAKYRSMELTPDGKLLKSITDQIFEIVKKQVVENITKKTVSYEPRKNIKIITTPGLSITALPDPIAAFMDLNSNIRFELVTEPTPRKLNLGEIVIRNDLLQQTNLAVNLLITLVSNFYASRKYLEKYGIPQSFNDLIYHKVLSFAYFNVSATDLYTLRHDRSTYLETTIQSNYIGFLVNMALKDQGILELPEIHPAIRLLEKITTIPSQTMDIFVGYLDVAEQDPIIYNFIEFLLKFLKDRNNYDFKDKPSQ